MFLPQKQIDNCDMMEVLAKPVMVIILQYIGAPNHHIIYVKHIQCYMSILSP